MLTNTPTDHPPGVVRGVPKVALRFCVRWFAVTMALIVVCMIGMMILVRVLPTTVLIRAVYIFVGSFAALSLAWFPWFAFRLRRLRKHLAAHPDACLNCAYETTDPAGVCPECAHRSDRSRLNRFWRRAVGAGDAPRPPKPEA